MAGRSKTSSCADRRGSFRRQAGLSNEYSRATVGVTAAVKPRAFNDHRICPLSTTVSVTFHLTPVAAVINAAASGPAVRRKVSTPATLGCGAPIEFQRTQSRDPAPHHFERQRCARMESGGNRSGEDHLVGRTSPDDSAIGVNPDPPRFKRRDTQQPDGGRSGAEQICLRRPLAAALRRMLPD